MRKISLFIGLLFIMMSSLAQNKMHGIGAEVSVLSFGPSARWWISKTAGFDVFGGISAEFEDFKPNDYEAGAKYLSSFMNRRTERTYFGLMGKWKNIKLAENNDNLGLPVVGIFIGKEWYTKRFSKRAFSIELGYQYGEKKFEVHNPINNIFVGTKAYSEFPLMLNIRYAFYKDR